MAPDGVVEAVDIAGNGLRGFVAGVEDCSPDELGFDGLEERLDHGIIVAISLSRHRDTDAVAAQLGLVFHRAVLGGFNGRRNGLLVDRGEVLIKCFGGCFPAQRLAGSAIERCGNSREGVGTMRTEAGALGEVLAQQPVGVFIGAALPGACGSQK